jgi:hypothetical protein
MSTPNPQAVRCKVLFSREQFVFCHINFPDVPERVSAIAHDGRYYSIFKAVRSAQATLALASKLSRNENELAITQAGLQYILWVYEPEATIVSTQGEQGEDVRLTFKWANEPEATVVSSQGEKVRDVRLTFKSATCLLLPPDQPYKFTHLTVPDLTHRTPGFQYGQRYYTLLHREQDAANVLTAAAELACRGGELALVPLPSSYALCVFEPNASPTVV